MQLKSRLLTLAGAVLLTALAGAPGKVLAADGEISKAAPLAVAHDSAPDDENAGDDVTDSGENTEQPAEHGESGEDGEDRRDNGSCITVSNVAVCIDQPR